MSDAIRRARVLCDWGLEGFALLSEAADAFVIVDVLSFSTTVEVALTRGAAIFPAEEEPEAAAALARQVHAELAGPRGAATFSLSPQTMLAISGKTRIVLPSRNGAALCLAAVRTGKPVFTACLRNARAIALALARIRGRIAVLPAGERRADGSLRFALEDWLGTGAVLGSMEGDLPPEAASAVASFREAEPQLQARMLACPSGRELADRGFAADVALAAELDVSDTVPELEGKSFLLGPRGEPGSVRRRFFTGRRLKEIPSKKSDRDQVLDEVMAMLPAAFEMPERELNELLGAIHPDFCTLRRDLVDGRWLARTAGVYRPGTRSREPNGPPESPESPPTRS